MASKKLTQNEVQAEPEIPIFIVGLDLGYGVVKAVCDGDHTTFPSVMGLGIPLTFQSNEILADHPGEQLTDGATGEEWFIGTLATSQIKRAQQLQLQGRDGNVEENMQFRKRLMYAALAKLLPHQHGKTIKVILATGLPVDHIGDAGIMRSVLGGCHPIHANNCDMVVQIDIIYIMPQPKGTVFYFMYNEDGSINQEQTLHRVAVHDVGRGTIDITVDQDGKFIKDESGSIEGGVFTVQEKLEDRYETVYGTKPSYEMLESILIKKEALIRGKEVDFSEWVAEAVKPLVSSSLSLMGRTIGKGLEIECIYLVGGGAELIEHDTVAIYPQAILVPDPQMTNARGYLRYAKFKAR